MRSAREIGFRVAQEVHNLTMYLRPPRLDRVPAYAPLALPDPTSVAAHLRDSAYAREVVRLADEVLAHRISLFGRSVEFGPQIRWRRDVEHGTESGLAYFRRIPYLDFSAVGDHKWIWELNRHQHLVLLAQAWRLTGRKEFVAEIDSQIASWIAANPFKRGINWTSALEVAFRALSWIWVWHLAGDALGKPDVFLQALYQHGHHLERNFSYFFSPNTHLLGEAVALHALGSLFPEFPRARQWEEKGAAAVDTELAHQVHPDGSHFEQSSYYHLYALDMFLFHRILRGNDASAAYDARLSAMAKYLQALASGEHPFPLFGDDDGGRLFHPYGDRGFFARATLATCSVILHREDLLQAPEDLQAQAAWWTGVTSAPQAADRVRLPSRLYPDAGMAIMRQGSAVVMVDAGGFGAGRAGHSHADSLSMVVFDGSAEILIDPGTYTYVSDPAWRDRFRGTAAHNTVLVDDSSQAIADGPFTWTALPQVRVRAWDQERHFLDAECRYRGLLHRRRILWKEGIVWIVDVVEGEGTHRVAQRWHPGVPAELVGPDTFRLGRAHLSLAGAVQVQLESGWRSRVFAAKDEVPVLRSSWQGELPVTMAAALCFDPAPGESLIVSPESGGVRLSLGLCEAYFPA